MFYKTLREWTWRNEKILNKTEILELMNTLSKIFKKKIIGRIMEEQMKEKKDRNENL